MYCHRHTINCVLSWTHNIQALIQTKAIALQPVADTAVRLVIVVVLPLVLVGAHAAPMTLHIAVRGAKAVQMHASAPVATQFPALSSMELVVEMILPDPVPVLADNDPATITPPLIGAQAVEVAASAVLVSPEPTGRTVVLVFLPHVPVRTDLAPTARSWPLR